ncbi:FAD/NAD(P)-binding domain-containing protein [Gymnopus androsaceus JB14]|uniref:FAD/NAD(P)-binding domain-containing protein n=1 Tax=Gymnopus androsaceus JB14 TaxID=1447944 RepID=A0A6A4GZJ4_9AGAR|nr:FAD/NAD(P)-binding domain-containing protein [Gymnopus androsaceus JB14]
MSLLESYDVVFAGGGTTACIVAGRLAQADPSLKILIIEAGSHTEDLHNHVQPARYLNNLGQGHTFSHHNSIPSDALGGRSICVPTGCCLGGGSAVNFMMYTRAAASDYDDWEKVGNSGWGSKDLIPLARKVETYQVASGDPSVHGFTGPIKISGGGQGTNIGREFLEVAAQYDRDRQMLTQSKNDLDAQDFYTVDVYSPWHMYIDTHTGKRSDTAHHFIYNLNPDSKRNLHILTNRRVVKVLFENNRAVGVSYAAHDDFNVLGEAKTPPQTVSGIGSAEHLAKAHVDQLVDLPGVGENYNDHNLCVTPYLSSEDSDCLDGIFGGDEEAIKPYLAQWTEKGSGLLAHNSIDSGIKLRPTPKELEELGPSFGQLWQDFYIGAPDKAVLILASSAGNISSTPSPPGSKTFSIPYYTLYPRAIGYTHITSGMNPWAPLKFNPGYLEECPHGRRILRWGYKRGRASGPVDIDAPDIVYSAEDDKAIDDHHRATYLSIVPLNVGANTYNTALIVGEKAFLLIAKDLGISTKEIV